ncbi:MAG: hypothetical protein IJX46_02195, partial [Clostridia bacterium]|nr:hypothetical protein [Clostridia bacterium]
PSDTVGAHCVRPPEDAPAAETVEEPVFAEEYCPPTVEITEEEPEIPADILDDEGSAELVEDGDFEESEPENPVSDISYENVKESDVDVMVALGFGDKIRDKFGDERIMRATKNLRKNAEIDEKERAFGYVGEEFTEKDQVASIRAAFVRDRRNLIIRLTVTAVFALALLLLENAALFGITLGGIFDPYKYPTAHAMLSLQLLVLCALPSWRSLYDGVVSAISGKATARSVLAFTLGIVALYDILIAIIAPSDGICLYNFPMALGLLLCTGAEYLDLRRENATFEILAQSDELYALTDAGDTPDGRIMISVERTRFVNGYFARTGRHEISSNALILTLVPIAAVGIIVAVVCAALGQGISRSLGGFAGVVAFGAPLSQIMGAAWAELNMSVTLSSRGAAVIGNSIDDEYSKAGILALDDSYAFPTGSAKIVGMQIYNNSEIYDTLYNLNALFSVAGGPLRELFYDSAKELGNPESAELGEYGTDFVSAKIDGIRRVCAGSREALTLRGIALPDDLTGDEDYTVMYFAVNGRACARVDCIYSFGSDFEDTAELLEREGISLRVRSLDPNINESLTEKLGARGRVEVSKEEHHALTDELDAGIVSKVGVRGLVRPLVLRRRTRGVMRAWSIAGYLGMAACTAFGTLLTVGGATLGLSALAALCRLLCFLPIVGLVFYAGRGNKKF